MKEQQEQEEQEEETRGTLILPREQGKERRRNITGSRSTLEGIRAEEARREPGKNKDWDHS